ncbi:unnamed protein product [Brachionus calyciflorus]|uniref:G-protein coupled receptors family 1 profile domain-containing protein n=1 Tax=Brachionus calyciflorus TaxID=104777 RepID=A0A814C460_9BILA|nr:unnamed protein product [Brachionus calyciflorus]
MQTSAWILTIISIDRYLIVTNSNWKQKFSRNIKFSIIVILSLIIVIAMINLPVVFFNGRIQNQKTLKLKSSIKDKIENILLQRSKAKKVECYTTKFIVLWQKVAFLLECISPLILMIIFNLLLIKRTFKSSVRLNRNERVTKLRHDMKKSVSMTCNFDPKESKSNNSNFDLTSSNDTKIPLKEISSSSVNASDVKTCGKISKNLKPFEPNNLIKKFNSVENSINKRYDDYDKKLKVETKCKNLSLNNLVFSDPNLKKPLKNSTFLSASNAISVNSCRNNDGSNLSLNNKQNDSGETNKSLIFLSDSYRSSNKYFLNYRNRRIVLMLSLLTLSFTISTLPSSIFYTFFRPILNNKPYKRLLTLSFNLLRHLSHTFNFMIYFTSSSVIKQQLKEIFDGKNCKQKISFNCCLKFVNNFCFYCCYKLKLKNSVSNGSNANMNSEQNANKCEKKNFCRTKNGEFRMKIYSLTHNSLQSNEMSSSFYQNQNDIEFIDDSVCDDVLFDNNLRKNGEIKVFTFTNKSNFDDSKTDTKNSNLNVPKLMLNSKCILKSTDQLTSWF